MDIVYRLANQEQTNKKVD